MSLGHNFGIYQTNYLDIRVKPQNVKVICSLLYVWQHTCTAIGVYDVLSKLL